MENLDQNTKLPLTPEEKKNLSRKRIYGAFIVLDVVLAILVIWAIIELFKI
jgi:hypothetical protein